MKAPATRYRDPSTRTTATATAVVALAARDKAAAPDAEDDDHPPPCCSAAAVPALTRRPMAAASELFVPTLLRGVDGHPVPYSPDAAGDACPGAEWLPSSCVVPLTLEAAKHSMWPFKPRGIRNPGNACYAAAVIQLLRSCPPFVQLCMAVSKCLAARRPSASATHSLPLTDALGRWFRDYILGPKGWGASSPAAMPPLSLPSLREELLGSGQGGRSAGLGSARVQQDAHEFLTSLLESITVELKAVGLRSVLGCKVLGTALRPDATLAAAAAADDHDATAPTSMPSSSTRGSWVTVGRGRTRLKVRRHVEEEQDNEEEGRAGDVGTTMMPARAVAAAAREASVWHFPAAPLDRTTGLPLCDAAASTFAAPVASIFSGELSSSIRTISVGGPGRKALSVTREPFSLLTLALPSSLVASPASRITLEELLVANYGNPEERIEKADAGGGVLGRTLRLHRLPNVLLCLIQRWAVDPQAGRVVKLKNRVHFGLSLTVPRSVLSGDVSTRPLAPPRYRLLSTVAHRGDSGASGHYVAHVVGGATPSASGATATLQPASSVVCYQANDERVALNPQGLATAVEDTTYLLCYVRT